MKTTLLTPVLLFFCGILAAQEHAPSLKSVTPLPAEARSAQAGHTTRAVVVGISDYQDPAIPDLRFADKDAEAFAQWLRSPAGLALLDSNINILINQQATTAQMIASLDWLIESSNPGDRAFIYFSGHGDVERVTKFGLGYLLSYNSPPAVYGAGAFSLHYLQAILTTLSENGVQVFIFTDSCRAGKLAGNNVGGTQATTVQLSKQFANEIKILSCQPDEFSLEGEQWGGGRGCFSYHLEDALYGFADDNHDLSVDLLELRRYLEIKVATEAAPQSQVPMVLGPAKTIFSVLQESSLATRRARRQERQVAFQTIEFKGMENQVLAAVDSSLRGLYALFVQAIDSGWLISPPEMCANHYFNILIEKQELAALHGSMKRQFAVALMDEGQTIINKVMQTDPQVLDNIWANRVLYDHLPAYFNRAAEILGEKHYVWRDLKAKEYYFKAMTIRAENYPDSSNIWRISEKRRLLNQALELDSMAAIVYYSLGILSPESSNDAMYYLQKAAELSPDWALIHSVLGQQIFYTDPMRSIMHFKKAIQIDSNYISSYHWISLPYFMQGQLDSADYWRQLYVRKFMQKWTQNPASVKAFECNTLGNALWMLGDYEKAKEWLLRGMELSRGKMAPLYWNLIPVYTDLLKFDSAIYTINALKKIKTIDYEDYLESGNIYFYFLNDTINAIKEWGKAGEIADYRQIEALLTIENFQQAYTLAKKNVASDITYGIMVFCIAESARRMGLIDSARHYYKLLIENLPVEFHRNEFLLPGYLFVALALDRLGDQEGFQKLLDTITNRLPGDIWLHFYLSCIYAQTGKEEQAISSLQKAIELGWQPNPLLWINGTLCDPMLNPIRETGGFKKLVLVHFQKYYDIATRMPGRK